jgi:hypothetical protein
MLPIGERRPGGLVNLQRSVDQQIKVFTRFIEKKLS